MAGKRRTTNPSSGAPASDQPVPCERCGQPHARCAAHRRDGEPCTQRPMKGQRVCRMHGGKSRGAVEKAERKAADEQAERELQKLWAGLGQRDAVTDPYAALAELAGSLRGLVDEAGLRVDSMKHLAGGDHLTQLRAEVVLFERVLGRYQATLESMGRLDVSGRHLLIQEQNAKVNREIADIVMLAATSAWAALARAVPDLLPEHRVLYLNTFTGRLGVPVDESHPDPAGVPVVSGTVPGEEAEEEA